MHPHAVMKPVPVYELGIRAALEDLPLIGYGNLVDIAQIGQRMGE